MKRIFSTLLATMLILSTFSFTATNVFAADGEIAIQAETLNNVLSSDGIKAAAKASLVQGDNAPDGITAVKVNPDPCEDRNPKYNVECRVILECYPTELGITPASYKYARLTYKYVPADGDTNAYSPSIEFRTKALGFTTYTSPDTVTANQWSTIDFEITGTTYAADDIISQLRVNAFGSALGTLDYEGGSYDANNVVLANPESTIYITNLAFFTEKPGKPAVTGISFASNTVTATRGTSVNVPKVTVSGVYSPITSYDLVLAGHTSAATKLSADGTTLMIGDDEESDTITLTATSVANSDFSATLTINVIDPAPRSTFDAGNVVMSFGVVSDIHLSGSWNQPRSKAKWSHVIDVFQNLGADAILMNGDLTDAVNSPGNVNGGGLHTDKNGNGTKAEQNFREVGYVAQAMWGADDGGYGNGTNSTTRMFYSLGNHDEGGQGYTGASSSRSFTEVYSADYFAAVICGWQYDPNSEAALAAPDGMEDSYRSYIADLLDYNNNPATTTVTAASFEASYGVTLASADAKFDKFFGFDSEYSLNDEHGLRYGNRHMTIDPDGEADADYSDDIHFIAMELSQSANSIAWAEEIIQKSISENPNKPIFIITHYKTAGTTVIGSQYQSITRLGDLLSKYPQTFTWGGHNHTFLHSDRAIDTSNGYVATDSAVTAYASMYNLTNQNSLGANSAGTDYAYNASTKENHAYGNGAFVEIDKDFNVRINRIDLYRSYSADYAENPALFSTSEFTNFASQASFAPVDEAVFIRTPWDLTDIGPEGTHLQDYTKDRFEKSDVPVFADSSSLSVKSGSIGAIPVTFTMDAEDDGMVYMYLLELTKKDSTEVLQRYYFTNKFYDYPDANIPALTVEHTFVGLSPNTTYTVHLTAVDDFLNRGVAITADATTLDGDTKVTLEDGTTAVFVDTTGKTDLYEWTDGKSYLAYGTMAEAVAAQADIIYVIECDSKLYFDDGSGIKNEFTGMKAGSKVIGLDREKAIIRYNKSYSLHQDLWFENVQISREGTSDCGITLQGKSLTLVSVKGLTQNLNLFNTGWGSADPSGTLVIKGDTGLVESIYTGPNYGDNAGSKGDINITLEGGTYGNVGNAKARPGNKIDGNVYITVTGGTYNAIKASQTSANHKVTKNAVLKLLGGKFTTVGLSGTTNVDGKDITIFTSAVLENIETFNKADNGIYITIPNNVTDAVGDATFDANGYITGFAVKQIDGKKSFVNGVAATSFNVESGKEYEITYKTPNAIEFDLNGGKGTVPATITGNAGDDVTSQMPDGTGVSKENHTFLGWSTDKNATSPDASFAITADGTVVYAVWQAKEKVTITLNANGGTCAVTAVEGFADETVTLPTAAKNGAVFVGWAESADAEEGFIDYTLSEANTLYAVFVDYPFLQVIYIDPKAETSGDGKSVYSPIKTFDAAAIALSKDVATTYVFMNSTCIDAFQDSEGAFATFTCVDPILGTKYDSYVYYQGSNMGSPRLSRNFVLDIPFAHARTDVDYICLNTRGWGTVFGANYFKPADGSIIPGTNIVCKTGFDQIRGGGDSVNPGITDLQFENLDNINAAIRAGSQQGNVVGNTSVTVFNGSKDAEIGLGNDSNQSNTIGGNAVLKICNYSAKATIKATANIDSIGGAVYYILIDDAADNVTIDDQASTKAAKGGYIIKSYGDGDVTVGGDELYIYSLTGELYINGIEQEISADNTYDLGDAGTYIITYDNLARNTVSYDLNGVDGTAPESYTAKENDAVVLPILDFAPEGMTFLGWNTDKDAEVALESVTMGKDALTLYAIWEKAKYDVAFDAGIGNALGELTALKKVHGEDLTLPTDYILYGTGLEFVGWSENPDATADEVVTAYTENAPTTFFAIYNNVGTAGVTIESPIHDGTYLVITESDAVVEVPEFDIPGTVTEVAKVDITLIDAATKTAVQPASSVTFTIHCDEDALGGKAVYVYHVGEGFVEADIDGDDVTFTTDSLSTFVVYTVEADATYITKGQYNNVTGLYTVSLYYNGKAANSGSFGFSYDKAVYTFDAFTYASGIDAVIATAHDEENAVVSGTWYPTSGSYIGGNDEDVLIGTFAFACSIEDYDMTLSADRFYEYKGAAKDGETFDGEYYLYAPNVSGSLDVTFAPIVTLDVVDSEPITVTYNVTGNLVTVREDGNAPISYAKAIVTTENGTKVAEFAIENADTKTGTVAFEFEMAPGSYKITVIKNGYLEATTSFVVADEDLDIGDIEPVAGDIRGNVADAQGDGVIDLADFVRIVRGFEFAEMAAHVDINEDGNVNVTDLGYVKANFGLTK